MTWKFGQNVSCININTKNVGGVKSFLQVQPMSEVQILYQILLIKQKDTRWCEEILQDFTFGRILDSSKLALIH